MQVTLNGHSHQYVCRYVCTSPEPHEKHNMISLVEILYRILQDFLGSYRILQDPIGSCKFTQDPTQDPVKSFRILLKIVQDPV